ncbi:hypothetical protein HAX54_032657 [Datura stramonium]|uniref:Uncharacterized protein n=1 Tax=Datura stramonium TaxID=4076 RepID=A0ABS8VB40_DATST|nr:hypothetical protein [Datura stramonium]
MLGVRHQTFNLQFVSNLDILFSPRRAREGFSWSELTAKYVREGFGAADFDENTIVGYLMSLGLFANSMVGYLVRFVFEGIDEGSLNCALGRAFSYYQENAAATETRDMGKSLMPRHFSENSGHSRLFDASHVFPSFSYSFRESYGCKTCSIILVSIHSHSALGITSSSGWTSSQKPITSPTSLPPAISPTSIET